MICGLKKYKNKTNKARIRRFGRDLNSGKPSARSAKNGDLLLLHKREERGKGFLGTRRETKSFYSREERNLNFKIFNWRECI